MLPGLPPMWRLNCLVIYGTWLERLKLKCVRLTFVKGLLSLLILLVIVILMFPHGSLLYNLCSDFRHWIFLLDSEGLVMLVKECFISACKVTATQGWEAGGEVRKGFFMWPAEARRLCCGLLTHPLESQTWEQRTEGGGRGQGSGTQSSPPAGECVWSLLPPAALLCAPNTF